MTAVPYVLGLNPGDGTDAYKYLVPLRQRATLKKSHRATSPLVRLVEREEKWEAPAHPQVFAGCIAPLLLLTRNSSFLCPPSLSLIRGLLDNSKLQYIAGERPLVFSQVNVLVICLAPLFDTQVSHPSSPPIHLISCLSAPQSAGYFSALSGSSLLQTRCRLISVGIRQAYSTGDLFHPSDCPWE
ncbi:hypothetical protein TNCV_1264511 [Trichonephila clavipes]|nr:hypothetical protein TNCV_1264511 [Trichonephila clavipes]